MAARLVRLALLRLRLAAGGFEFRVETVAARLALLLRRLRLWLRCGAASGAPGALVAQWGLPLVVGARARDRTCERVERQDRLQA